MHGCHDIYRLYGEIVDNYGIKWPIEDTSSHSIQLESVFIVLIIIIAVEKVADYTLSYCHARID